MLTLSVSEIPLLGAETNDAAKIGSEIRILEDLRERLTSSLKDLSDANDVDPSEKERLRGEAHRLLDMTQKSLLRRQIMIRVNGLGSERILLSALNEKHYALSRLSSQFQSGQTREPTHRVSPAPSTYLKPRTGDDLHEELKRVREQIYRTIASEGEEEKTK